MTWRRRAPRPDVSNPRDENFSLLGPGGKVASEAVAAAADTDADEDGLRRVAFRLTRDLRKRVDRYLTDRVPFLSRSRIQRLIDEEAVTVNGAACKASTILKLGDLVEVVVPPPAPDEVQPERIPLDVIYEDNQIIVVNKPPDLIVHPARSHQAGTMVNALAWHFQNVSSAGGALSSVGVEFARPGVVHRLDRDTSGAIVFAKQDEAHWQLGRQFEKRTVEKRYITVVHGSIEPKADVIDLPIGPAPSRVKGHREKCVVRHDEQGKHAVTFYRTLERYDGFTTCTAVGGRRSASSPAPSNRTDRSSIATRCTRRCLSSSTRARASACASPRRCRMICAG